MVMNILIGRCRENSKTFLQVPGSRPMTNVNQLQERWRKKLLAEYIAHSDLFNVTSLQELWKTLFG